MYARSHPSTSAAHRAAPSLMPPASTMGPSNICARRAHECERIEPSGLPARARSQKHQAIDARGDGFFGMPNRRDVREHRASDVVQRPDRFGRRTDAGDDHFDAMAQHAREFRFHLGALDDQVGAKRRGRAIRDFPSRALSVRLSIFVSHVSTFRSCGHWRVEMRRSRRPCTPRSQAPVPTPPASARRSAEASSRRAIFSGRRRLIMLTRPSAGCARRIPRRSRPYARARIRAFGCCRAPASPRSWRVISTICPAPVGPIG